MEYDTGDSNGWVPDAEKWIGQIPGVRQGRIELDTEGEVTGIHVVAGPERQPALIVRDVKAILKARLGLTIDHNQIGVVQVVDPESGDLPDDGEEWEVVTEREPAGSPGPTAAVILEETAAPRLLCNGVGVMATEENLRAEVELQAGPVEARCVEEGPNHPGSDLLLIGRATVGAIGQLLAEPVILNLGEIRVETLVSQEVVLVGLEVVEGRRSEKLFGSCATSHNRHQAVVYAVLDGLNRRLALMAFKSAEMTP